MKSTYFRSNPFLSASSACAASVFVTLSPLGTRSATAADAAWNVDAAGTWVTNANWNPALAPGIADGVTLNNPDIATFGFPLTAARDVTVDLNRNIGGITLANASGVRYRLLGQPILLSNGGTVQVTSAATSAGNFADEVNSAIQIQGNAGTATFTGNATSNTRRLDISGGVTGVSTAGNTTTLNLNGSGNGLNSFFTGLIADGTAGGNLKVVKSGTGFWSLFGANSFTGGVTLQAGTLQVTNATALGSGVVQLQGGVFTHNGANFSNSLNVTGPITYINTQDNANGAHIGAITGNGTLTFPNSIIVGATTFNSTSSWKWNGSISGFTGTFIFDTPRNIIFQGNAFDGSNAKWQVNGAAFSGISLADTINNPGKVFKMGELTGSATGVMFGEFNSATAVTYEVGALGTNSTYAGLIKTSNNNSTTQGLAALRKVGGGILTLTNPTVQASGVNLYGGPTTISAGTLVAAGASALGSNNSGTTVAAGATLDLQANPGAEAVSISGTGATGSGALIASTGTGTLGGIVTLTTDASLGGAGSLLLNGAVNGGFGITKSGAGTTTLGAFNNYTGSTIITGGTLSLGASGSVQSSSGVFINGSGAKFQQSNTGASAPAVTLTQGTLEAVGTVASLSVATGGGGIVTTNNTSGFPLVVSGALAFGGAATVNLTTNSNTPVISVADLSTASAGVVLNITNSTWTNGTYPLISYSNSFTGVLENFTKGTVPNLGSRQTATLTNANNAINLEIDGFTPVWDGSPGGNWTTSVDAVPTNWKKSTDSAPTNFLAGDSVLFNDTAAGTTTVNISAAPVSPAGITFANNGVLNGGLDYILTGNFGISTGSLLKSGLGPLTIQTANAYSGGTILSAGTLNLESASAIGTGSLTIAGTGVVIDNTSASPLTLSTNNPQSWNSDFTFQGTNPLNLGTGAVVLGGNRIVTTAASSLTVGGAISGLFSLTKSGPGTLVLGGANSYTLGTTITEGTLTGTTASIQGPVVNSASLVFDQATDGTYAGAISGNGGVTKLNGNILTLSGGSNFTGTTTVAGGTLQLNAGGSAGLNSILLGGNTLVLNFSANLAAGVSGAGTINTFSTVTPVFATNMSAFTGTLNVPSAAGGGNKVAVNAAAGSIPAGATINVASGGTFYTENAGVNIGATVNVSGTGNSENLGALRVDTGSEISGPVNLLGTTNIGGPGTATNSGTISGVISGAFGINKVRASGAVTLTAANLYTGPTTISGGILRVNGSLAAASAVTVNAGCTLAGTGTIAGTLTTVGNNSTVAPGSGGIGTLTVGTTSLTGILATEFNATTSDQLNVAGNLTLIAGSTLTLAQLVPVAATRYVVVKYTGTLTGTFAAPVLPSGYALVYDGTAKEIAVVKSGFVAFMDTFTLSAADKLPGADPDFDGVNNLVEYALAGFNPTISNGSPGAYNGIQIVFTKRDLAVANNDLTYAIEESTTLGAAPDPWAAVTHVLPDVNNATTISYTLPPSQPKEFARLKVVKIP